MTKSIRCLLQLIGFLTLTCTSYAGSYQPQIVQNIEMKYDLPSGTQSVPYGISGGSSFLFSPRTYYADSLSTHCSGNAKINMNWVPDYPGEPEPEYVIIEESIELQIYLKSDENSVGAGVAAASNDSFNEQIDASNHYSFSNYNGYSKTDYTSVTKRRIVKCDEPIVLQIALSGYANSPYHLNSSYKAIQFDAYYRFRVNPVRINLTNVAVTDNGVSTKIGKKITSTLSAGTQTAVSFKNYKWGVQGSRIKGYDWDAQIRSDGSFDRTPTRLIPIPFIEANEVYGSSTWWWWKKGICPVTCSADATVDGVTTSVNAEIQVEVNGPSEVATFNVSPTISTEDGYASTFKNLAGPPLKRQLISSSPGETIAFKFEGNVQEAGVPASQTKDKWFFLQLIKRANTAIWSNNQTGQTFSISPPDLGSGYPDFVLDGSIVYGQPNDSLGLTPYKVNSGQFGRTDTPTFEAVDQVPGNQNLLLNHMSVTFNARLYLMYLPDGTDSLPVPLGRYDWQWTADQDAPWPSTGDEPTHSSIIDPVGIRGYDIPTWRAVAPPS